MLHVSPEAASGGPIAALENGQIDVACNTSPTTDLMVKRGKAIMFTHNSIGRDPAYDDFLFELLYVRPDYAKANPDTVRTACHAMSWGTIGHPST